MRIKPVIEQSFVEVINDEVIEDDVVSAVTDRLLQTNGGNRKQKARVLAQIALSNNGLSVEQTAGQVARMAQHARDDTTKLSCLKMALEIHEVLLDDGDKHSGTKIQIVISGDNDITVSGADLNSMLSPER